jgi:hypothetical protein
MVLEYEFVVQASFLSMAGTQFSGGRIKQEEDEEQYKMGRIKETKRGTKGRKIIEAMKERKYGGEM